MVSLRLHTLCHEMRRQQRLWQLRRLKGQRNAATGSQDAITVYGLFSAASGLGQAARLLADNLEQIGHRVYRIDAAPHLLGVSPGPDAFDRDPGVGPIIIHLNPVEAAEIMVALAPPELVRRPRIGVWLYELDRAPDSWRPYVPLFDMIWSPSEASARAMKAIGAKVRTVPYCHSDMTHVQAGPEGDVPGPLFTVMAMADARSSLARKNISGALAAFRSAFGDDPSTRLILKVANLPGDTRLREHVAAFSSIDLIETRLSFPDTMTLIRQADTFLSLHRGEGYGLTLVEAMQMGVPVVMTDEPSTRALQVLHCSWAVPSRQIRVDDPQQIYSHGHWADPDVDKAAIHLRTLKRQWDSGQLAKGRDKRMAAAARHFSAPERLVPLREAMARLPMKKAPQPELRSFDIQDVKAF